MQQYTLCSSLVHSTLKVTGKKVQLYKCYECRCVKPFNIKRFTTELVHIQLPVMHINITYYKAHFRIHKI